MKAKYAGGAYPCLFGNVLVLKKEEECCWPVQVVAVK
jgi:hypothetical protein